MHTIEKSEAIKRKMRSNTYFCRKVRWFRLGQRRCSYCCTQLNWTGQFKNSATVEHLVPRSHGGTDKIENIIIVCYKCNMQRRNDDFIDWVAKTKPMKSDWLITKYTTAVKSYETTKTLLVKSMVSC